LVPQSTPTIHQEAKSHWGGKKKQNNPETPFIECTKRTHPTDHPIKKLREHITDSSRGYPDFDKKKKKRKNLKKKLGCICFTFVTRGAYKEFTFLFFSRTQDLSRS